MPDRVDREAAASESCPECEDGIVWHDLPDGGQCHGCPCQACDGSGRVSAPSPVVDRDGLRKRLKYILKTIEATDGYPANEYLRGIHTGYRAVLTLLDEEARNGD